ncbi:hypothetical protein B0J11DRAFT_594005 [Dendryphion nanum]|uniref:Uncharacterized protein n=1 Tax=Dendryphion nanum TaxID=256645 RepID=A0A9P9DBJ3_9PLEO|nr:hypothetical protein B0J11DRAFT_594005 [Dendryphion nanum]
MSTSSQTPLVTPFPNPRDRIGRAFDFSRFQALPIFTEAGLRQAVSALAELEKGRNASIQDVFGDSVTVPFQKLKHDSEVYCIELNDLLDLAEVKCEREEREDADLLLFRQRFCPYKISTLHRIDRIVIFGRCKNTAEYRRRTFLQYHTVSMISKVLGTESTSDLPVYCLDAPHSGKDYEKFCKVLSLATLTPVGLHMALTLVDNSTLVVSDTCGPHIEAAIEMAGPDGPAALLCPNFSWIAEDELSVADRLPDEEFFKYHDHPRRQYASRRVHRYREECDVTVIDDSFVFGGRPPRHIAEDRQIGNFAVFMYRKKNTHMKVESEVTS